MILISLILKGGWGWRANIAAKIGGTESMPCLGASCCSDLTLNWFY